MRNIAIWANQYRWAAHLIIAFGGSLLALSGLTIGIGLFQQNIYFATPLIVVVAWFMLIAFYVFPKNEKNTSDAMGYFTPRLLQTACHFVLYFTAFILFVAAGNRLPEKLHDGPVYLSPLQAFITQRCHPPAPQGHYLNQKPSATVRAAFAKYNYKTTAQTITFRQQLPNGAGSWLLLVSSGLTGLLLTLLLTGLSRNILCSGTEAAAALASLVGLGVWIGGVVLFGMIVVGVGRE